MHTISMALCVSLRPRPLRPFSPKDCRHLGEVLVHLGGGFVALEILALDQALNALLQVDGLGGELELWEASGKEG